MRRSTCNRRQLLRRMATVAAGVAASSATDDAAASDGEAEAADADEEAEASPPESATPEDAPDPLPDPGDTGEMLSSIRGSSHSRFGRKCA